MNGSKLLKVIRALSKNELKSLSAYLQSPYFLTAQQQESQFALFSLILKDYQKEDHPNLNKSAVYMVLFPGEKPVKGKLEKRMSALLGSINAFIALHFSHWYGDEDLDLLSKASFYRERKHFNTYQKLLQQGRKNLAQEKIQSPEHLFKKFLLEKESYQDQALWHKSSDKFQLYNQLFSLDAYYLLHKLEYACFFLSLKNRVPINIENLVLFLDQVKPLYEKQGVLESPVIKIFYQVYELLKKKQGDESAYYKLREYIQTHESEIPFFYLRSWANYQRGFIIMQCNHGAIHLSEELFSLYKEHLKKGYLEEKLGITPSTYKNIVTIGLRFNDFDWVLQFFNQYKHKIIGASHPQNVHDYNLATYYFHKREFDQALALLTDNYEDLYYKMAAKRLELKIYYEIDFELLDAKMDAFKIYTFRLPKTSIRPLTVEWNNNFINFLRQLRNPKTKYDPQRIKKLESNIKSCENLFERTWLLKKLKEF